MEPRVLSYDIAGEGDPLVLIPGGLTGWVSWIPHQERLSSEFKVVRVQPTHNELGSAGVAGDPTYGIDLAVESLRLTLDDLGLDSPHFGAWSAGGHLLLEFVRRHPGRVRSMVLVEPAAHWILSVVGFEDPRLDAFNDLMERMAGAEVSDDDFAAFLALAGFDVDDPSSARTHPYWGNGYPHRQTLSWMSSSYFDTDATLDDLRAIAAPTMAVKGTVTDAWEMKVVDTLGECIPDARVLELQGSHACHIESIEDFIPEFEAHLRRA